MAFSLIPGSSIEEKKQRIFNFKELRKDTIFRFLTVTILFLIIVATLLYFYKMIILSSTESIETEIKEVDKQRDIALENEIQGRIDNLRKMKPLLESHRNARRIFDFSEANILDEVTFSSFDFDANDNKISLSGSAQNTSSLISQDFVFRNSPSVKNSEIEGLSLTDSGVSFSYTININEDDSFFEINK